MTDVIRNYRSDDPVTSREAGERAREFSDSDQEDILFALNSSACVLAAEEISDRLKWNDHVRVNRRLSELERKGLIVRTTERHTNRSGRAAFRYRAT